MDELLICSSAAFDELDVQRVQNSFLSATNRVHQTVQNLQRMWSKQGHEKGWAGLWNTPMFVTSTLSLPTKPSFLPLSRTISVQLVSSKKSFLNTVWSNQIETVRKRPFFISFNLWTTRLDKLWAKKILNFCWGSRGFRIEMRSLVQKW